MVDNIATLDSEPISGACCCLTDFYSDMAELFKRNLFSPQCAASDVFFP